MPLGIGLATLLASGLKTAFDAGSTVFANKYNSPRAQLKRLRKAGLPLSYMYEGKISQQSAVPQLSIEPTLGLLPKQEHKALKLENELKDLDNQIWKLLDDQLPDEEPGKPSTMNQRAQFIKAQILEKQAGAILKQGGANLNRIQGIIEQSLLDSGVSIEVRKQALEKVKQEIINMGKQAGLMDTLQQQRAFDAWLNSTLQANISSLPGWAQVITAALIKMSQLK